MFARLAKILSVCRWHDTPASVAHANTTNRLAVMSRQLPPGTAIMKAERSVPSIRQQLNTNSGTFGLSAPAKSGLDIERVHAAANAEGSVAPAYDNTWVQIRERSRLYTASITFWLARIMLVLAIRSFRSGMLLLSDVKFVFRVSERLRRIAWRLLKSKRQSSKGHLRR
jgi:hypothetical protein